MHKFVSRTLFGAATLLVSMSLSFSTAQAEEKHKLQGQKFPQFSLNNLDGKGKFSEKDMKGKIVLVDFWASWCEPCKISFPVLDKLAKKYKGKIVIVGINVDENPADAKTFLKENPVKNLKLLSDSKNEFIKKVDVKVMPTSFLVDKDGTVKLVHQGYHAGDDQTSYEPEIKKLLKGK